MEKSAGRAFCDHREGLLFSVPRAMQKQPLLSPSCGIYRDRENPRERSCHSQGACFRKGRTSGLKDQNRSPYSLKGRGGMRTGNSLTHYHSTGGNHWWTEAGRQRGIPSVMIKLFPAHSLSPGCLQQTQASTMHSPHKPRKQSIAGFCIPRHVNFPKPPAVWLNIWGKAGRVCRACPFGSGILMSILAPPWGISSTPLTLSEGCPCPLCTQGAGAIPAPCCLFIKKPLSLPCHLIMHSGHKDAFSLTKEAYLYDERALRPHKIELSLKALLESKPHLFRNAWTPSPRLSPSSLAHF